MKQKATIIVTRSGATLLGVPWGDIAGALTARWHESETVQGQIRIRPRRQAFAELQDDGVILAPAGLLQRLRTTLEALGYPVAMESKVFWLPLQAAATGLQDRGEKPNDLQRAFLQHAFGQVAASSYQQAGQVIVDVARLYPMQNILVVAKNRQDVRTIANGLRDRYCTRVKVLGENNELSTGDGLAAGDALLAGDITITTVATGVGGGTWRYCLAFYVGIEAALNLEVAKTYAIDACRHVMRYLIRLPSRTTTPHEELSLESLFGGKIHECFSVQKLCVPRVGWLPSNRLFPRGGGTGLRRKQRDIWHNGPRNQVIAQAALAMDASDLPGVQQLGCRAACDVLAGRRLPATVAILVESLEHAEQLQLLLPGWSVLSANASSKATRRLIVTQAYAIQHGVGTDIVISATAGRSCVKRATLRPEVLLLVDLVDIHSHAVAEKHAAYCRLGYDVDPLPTAQDTNHE